MEVQGLAKILFGQDMVEVPVNFAVHFLLFALKTGIQAVSYLDLHPAEYSIVVCGHITTQHVSTENV